MVLVHPPVARSVNPPLALARLAGWLRASGGRATCLDLSAEGCDYLLRADADSVADAVPRDGFASRGVAPPRGVMLALRRRGRDLASLSGPDGYGNFDRYKKSVLSLEASLGALTGGRASLADYRDPALSPARRADLLEAARCYRDNPYYPLFARRIGEALEADLARGGPGAGWVGISLGFLSQALAAFAIAGFLRAEFPRARVALGGGLVNSWRGQNLVAPDDNFGDGDLRDGGSREAVSHDATSRDRGGRGLFDAVLAGRGEDSLAALIGLPRVEATPDFADFRGGRYFAPGRVLPYNLAWGCPWAKCEFCPEKAEGFPYLPLRPGRALAELASIAEREEPALFHFTDSELPPSALRLLAGNPPGAPWHGFARFTEELADPAFCRALARSGCAMLQLGLESADPAVLAAMGKGTTPGLYARVLAALKEAGIPVYAYLLFGTPAEDRDAALRTRDFVAAHAAEIAFLNLAVFNLPASGAEAAALDTRPFYEGELSLYREFRHPRGFDRDAARRFIARDFETVPELRAIVLRNPPAFTSSHAPFFAGGAVERPEEGIY